MIFLCYTKIGKMQNSTKYEFFRLVLKIGKSRWAIWLHEYKILGETKHVIFQFLNLFKGHNRQQLLIYNNSEKLVFFVLI